MKQSILLSILIVIGMSSFSFSQKRDIKEFSMTKGSCHGSCPEYTLEVYQSGNMVFIGKKNTSRNGVYEKKLKPTQLLEIRNAFQASNFKSFNNYYDSRVPDLPTISITYHELRKTITGKESRPKVITDLEKLLTRYADIKDGWKVIPRSDNVKSVPPEDLFSEIIILVSEKTNIKALVGKYHQYELKIVKRVAPNQYYWVLAFNAKRMPPKKMVSTLQREEGVISAQLNMDTIKPRK